MSQLIIKEYVGLQYLQYTTLLYASHEEQFRRVHAPRIQGRNYALI